MKVFSKLKTLTGKFVAAGVVAAAIVGFVALKPAAADVSISTPVDCDWNAVMYCGATSTSTLASKYTYGDGKNSTSSIHNVYSYFGISSSEVTAMRSQAVAGYVTKSGNVYANGELVATGAVTAGRGYIAGSTKVTYNGTTFYKRAPSVSFRSDSIKAYVVMVNGKFSHAVLASCGNPVKATPKSPDYAMSKAVRVKGSSTWVNDVTVKSGTHVEYRIQVASRGQVSARNVVVRDVLPANTKYVGYTMKRDGVAIASDRVFGSGDVISKIAPGKFVTYTFEAIIGSSDKVETCVPQKLVNTAKVAVPGLPSKSDTANVNKTCAPKPAYACISLTNTKVSRTSYNFTAKASATNGAVITGYKYTFGDGTTKTVATSSTTNTTDHTYPRAATYTATVVALVKVGTTVKEVAGTNCKTTITVAPAPAAECKDLVLTKVSGRTYNAKVTYTVSGGASLKNIWYDFGDTTTLNSTNTSVNHTYTKDGAYTVKATLTFNATESTPASTCEAKITIVTPSYTCDSLTATKVSRTNYSFASKATVAGGATVAGYKYVYGDGQSQTVNSTATTNTVNHTYANPGTYTTTVTVLVKVGAETKEVTSAACKATATVVAAPAAECKDLVLTKGAGRLVNAKVTYAVSGGASLQNIAYSFGDNSAVVNTTNTSVDHTYAADGSYTVKATLTFNGSESVPSSTCEDKITINTVTPAYSCDAFSIAKGEGRMVNVNNFKYSATGGATFKNVTIDWGDQSTPLVSTNPVGQTHTYAADGSYTVKATATFVVNGQDVTDSGDCEDQVVFSPAPVCEINPNLPKDSPDCKVCVYNPELPFNSEDCKQPETPQVLPATGIGSVLGIFAGTAALASIGYYFVAARRVVRG